MQNYIFTAKTPAEKEKLANTFKEFKHRLKTRVRPNLVRNHNQIVFTGTNEDFFKFRIYHYFLSLCVNGNSTTILKRLDTTVKYPTTKDPAMVSGNYLEPTKDLRSHAYAMDLEYVQGYFEHWVSEGRLIRGVNNSIFMTNPSELEIYMVERFNREPAILERGSKTLGVITL